MSAPAPAGSASSASADAAPLLTELQLSEFRATGLLVVEDILTAAEVSTARAAFHAHLATLGIDHDAILAGAATMSEGARIKSPVSRIFYPDWKLLAVHMHPRVTQAARELLLNTYGSGADPDFPHPFGPFTSIRTYVDRICYRMPDAIREEGGLGLHLDRDPVDPYLLHAKTSASGSGGKVGHGSGSASPVSSALSKWRPIQAFVCLTDHFGGDSGGLRVVSGFHKRIDSYFAKKVSEGGGEFFRMNHPTYDSLQKACQPVVAPAGSMVFWDNRLPHATASKLAGHDTREVVYTGFLPDVPLNRSYVSRQLAALRANKPPPAYEEHNETKGDRNWEETQLTAEQKEMLGCNDQGEKH